MMRCQTSRANRSAIRKVFLGPTLSMFVLLLLSVQSSASTDAIQSSVRLDLLAQICTSSSCTSVIGESVTPADSQATSTSPLSVSDSLASSGTQGGMVYASGSAAAAWVTPAAGTISLSGAFGFDNVFDHIAFAHSVSGWSYTFSTTSDSVFILTYQLSDVGYFELSVDGYSSPPPDSSGRVVVPISGVTPHTIDVTLLVGAGSGQGVISSAGARSFAWVICENGSGCSQETPILPNNPSLPMVPDTCDACSDLASRNACMGCLNLRRPCFEFCAVPSLVWVDPPTGLGYEYEMTSDSLFTHILDFPTGFGAPFSVLVNGVALPGSFGPGDSVDFGAGVEKFVITGIAPGVDASDPAVFPIKLAFNTPTASFRMRPLTCKAAPETTCEASWGKGRLAVRENRVGKETLIAKLSKGPPLTQGDFGNPMTAGGTDYSVCIYSDVGTLAGSFSTIAAGADCGGDPCWKPVGGDPPTGRGFKYKDKDLSSDGTKSLRLVGTGRRASSIAFSAKNNARKQKLNLPTGLASALAGSGSATVQLVRLDSGACFSINLTSIKTPRPGVVIAE